MEIIVSSYEYTKYLKRLKRLNDCKIIKFKEYLLLRTVKIMSFK